MCKIVILAKNPGNQGNMDVQLFDSLLVNAGLTRKNIEFVSLDQVSEDKLLTVISNLKPDIVVPFGSECLRIFLQDKKSDLMKIAGKPFNFSKDNFKFTVIPTVSLKYLKRNEGYIVRAQRHWEDIGRIAKGGSLTRPKAPTKYIFIQDIEKARNLFKRIEQCKVVSFDLETTGLNFQTDRILCYSFSWKPYTAVVLPILGFKETEIWTSEEKEEINKHIREIFKNPNIEWVAQNISFDEKFLLQRGIHIEGSIHDTMQLSTIIDENAKDLRGLKPLAELYTDLGDYDEELEKFTKDLKIKKVQELHKKKKILRDEIKKVNKYLQTVAPQDALVLKNKLIDLEYDLEEFDNTSTDISYAEIPTDILWPYAAMDADATIRIFILFYYKKLRQISDMLVKPYGRSMVKLYNKLIMPLRKVLNKMEFIGAQVDLDYLRKLDDEYTQREDLMEKELFAMPEIKKVEKLLWQEAAEKVGQRFDNLKKPPKKLDRNAYIQKYTKAVTFNMNSANHLRLLIYNVLGVKPFKFTDTKLPSTDKEVLEELSKRGVHSAIEKLQKNRSIQKLHKTYVKGMQKRADVNARVHTDFNQHITVTGRLSSSNPNLQNIPRANKDIKRAFITQPGWSIVQADYSQAEFRMWAQLSQDQDMINDIAAGMDIHSVTAREFWGIPEDQPVPKERRSAAKFVVFGLMYGRGAKSVAKQVGIQDSEAEAIIKNFFAKYPVAARWLKVTQNFAKTHNYVWNHFGRVRRLPHATSPDNEKAGEAMRQAVNAPIQGSAADMTGIALIRINRQLEKQNMCARLLLTVHDSIVLECPDEEILDVVKICHDCMTSHIEGLNVPMEAEIEVGKTWADVEEWPVNQFEGCHEKYLKYGTVNEDKINEKVS